LSALHSIPSPRITVCPTFAILGPPRTKKTHSRIIRNLGRAMLIPSAQYTRWFKDAMKQAAEIRRVLAKAWMIPKGFCLPISQPMNVRALFYREALTGDACGYYQALGDFLQAPKQSKKNPGKLARNGAGIIADDSLIASWDGSRLLKDAAHPRIEVTLELYEVGQIGLALEDAW
jgi:hypothetical protein